MYILQQCALIAIFANVVTSYEIIHRVKSRKLFTHWCFSLNPLSITATEAVATFQARVGDVIMYELNNQQQVGYILSVMENKIIRLCIREDENEIEANGDIKFYYDESDDGSIVTPIDTLNFEEINDHVYISQRQISDRKINPHSEESEDVFFIKSTILPKRFLPKLL